LPTHDCLPARQITQNDGLSNGAVTSEIEIQQYGFFTGFMPFSA
jgi:hypothetical protein